jgi:hypothetical protein
MSMQLDMMEEMSMQQESMSMSSSNSIGAAMAMAPQINQDFNNMEDDMMARLAALDSPKAMRKSSLGAAKEEKKNEGDKLEEDLPLLDDILNKFNVEGLFDVHYKELLKPFLTEESRRSLDDILAKNASFAEYILTKVVMMILQERFATLKGEWEMIVRKTKRSINPTRSTVSAELQAEIDSIKCVEGELGE